MIMIIDALLYCFIAFLINVRSYEELVKAASRYLEIAILLMFRQNKSNI